ncbi:unnamed protein product [Ixodes pacificus]
MNLERWAERRFSSSGTIHPEERGGSFSEARGMRNTLSGALFARTMVATTLLELLPLASHSACVLKVSTNDVAGVGAARRLMSRSRRSVVEVSAKKHVGVTVVAASRPLHLLVVVGETLRITAVVQNTLTCSVRRSLHLESEFRSSRVCVLRPTCTPSARHVFLLFPFRRNAIFTVGMIVSLCCEELL